MTADPHPLITHDNPTADSRIKQRLADIVASGVKTIPGMAHRAGITFDETRLHLAEMLTLGYFKLRTAASGRPQLHLAQPGDALLSPDVHTAVAAAIHGHRARTPEQIAAVTGLPLDRHLLFAIGVTIRGISAAGNP